MTKPPATPFLPERDRVAVEAEEYLVEQVVGIGSLVGKTFLDASSGDGLRSLAAHRLGASRVVSFDPDPDAVTRTRKRRDRQSDALAAGWSIVQGSMRDEAFVRSLGTFDVVCAVEGLHTSGDLWSSVDHLADAVAPEGTLIVGAPQPHAAGIMSLDTARWRDVREHYLRATPVRRTVMQVVFVAWRGGHELMGQLTPRPQDLARRLEEGHRWMSLPAYEAATREEFVARLAPRGFTHKLTLPGASDPGTCDVHAFVRGAAPETTA